MDVDTLSIIGNVIGTGLAIALLIMRIAPRLDADRRAHQASTDAFRIEMRELAERQARVEGPTGRSVPVD